MLGLGFSSYIAHGGDIGSFISRILAVRYASCKAIHLNFCLMQSEPPGIDPADITPAESKNLSRLVEFGTNGNAYAKEHGTKGATIGLALSASPLALLCWIGEKYIEWTDTTPSTDDILDSVTLYWFTQTFPRSIYPYIEYFGRGENSTVFHGDPEYHCKKPIGYSYFPYELGPAPLAWAKKTGNVVWHHAHESVRPSLFSNSSYSLCPPSPFFTSSQPHTISPITNPIGRPLPRARETQGAPAGPRRVHRVSALGESEMRSCSSS